MAVFLNGPIGPLVVLCVELDSNYVIETAPVLLRLMEENVAKARISQKGEHARWDLVSYQVTMLLVVSYRYYCGNFCPTWMSKEEIYIFVPPLKKEEILILP